MTVDDSTRTHKWLRGLYAPLTEERHRVRAAR